MRHTVDNDGTVTERKSLQSPSHAVDQHLTIGPARNFIYQTTNTSDNTASEGGEEKKVANTTLPDLFPPPVDMPGYDAS